MARKDGSGNAVRAAKERHCERISVPAATHQGPLAASPSLKGSHAPQPALENDRFRPAPRPPTAKAKLGRGKDQPTSRRDAQITAASAWRSVRASVST